MSSTGSCASGEYIWTRSFDSSGRNFTCLATPTISATAGLALRHRVGLSDTRTPIVICLPMAARRKLRSRCTTAGCPAYRVRRSFGPRRSGVRASRNTRADDLILRGRAARSRQWRIAHHLEVERVFRTAMRPAAEQLDQPRLATPGSALISSSTASKNCSSFSGWDTRTQRIHHHRQRSRRDSRDRRTRRPGACAAATPRRRTAARRSRLRPRRATPEPPPPPVDVRLSDAITSGDENAVACHAGAMPKAAPRAARPPHRTR